MKSLPGFKAAGRCAQVAGLGLILLLAGAGSVCAQNQLQSATQSSTQSHAAAQGSGQSSSSSDDVDQYWLSPPVVKLGALLGMKPETASHVFQLLNLLLLGTGISYGLLKLLPVTFRRRNAAIQRHLVDARTVTEEAAARLSSVEERLSRLDAEIESIRLQAEADSVLDEQLIQAGVAEEKDRILAAAEAEIQSAADSARRDLQRYAAELAVEQAERKLVVTAETDRRLVEGFARRLGEGSNN